MTKMPTTMTAKIWWAQIKAVIRLETKKTFFAKRGLWIYVLAALPVLMFIAYVVATVPAPAPAHATRARGRKAPDLPGSDGG